MAPHSNAVPRMSDEGDLGFMVGADCTAKFLTDIGICQVP
jgi:hypothetical protein